jgi:hypothetical protein
MPGITTIPFKTLKKRRRWNLETLVGRFNFSSTIYSEKCRLFFRHFFAEKNGEIFKAFLPLFNFLLSFSPQTGKVVKMF